MFAQYSPSNVRFLFLLPTLLSLIIVFFYIAPASAQKLTTTDLTAEYQALVEKSFEMPEGFDFKHMRELYGKLPDYSPYGVAPQQDFAPFFERLEKKDVSALQDIAAYTRKHFALPQAHARAMSAYNMMDKKKEAAYHEWALRGLLDVLMRSGNGAGPATAFHVLNVPEEYMVARNRIDMKQFKGQRVHRDKSGIYDVLTGVSKQSGQEIDLWFNTTVIWSSEKL